MKALGKLNEPLVEAAPPRFDRPAATQPSKRKTTVGPKADEAGPRQKRVRGPGSPPGGPAQVPMSSVSVGSPATSQGTRASRAGGNAAATPPPDNAFDPEGQEARPEAGRGRLASIDSLDRNLDRLWSRHDHLLEKIRDLGKDQKKALQDAVKERDLKIAALERILANLQGKVEALTAFSGGVRAPPRSEPVARPVVGPYVPYYYDRQRPYESYDRGYSTRDPYGSYDRSYDRSYDCPYERSREAYSDYHGQSGSYSRESQHYRPSEEWPSHAERPTHDPTGPQTRLSAEPLARSDETEEKPPVAGRGAESFAPGRGTA